MEKKNKNSKASFYIIIALAVLLIGGAVFALSFFSDISDPGSMFEEAAEEIAAAPEVQATPEPAPEPTPSPTPDPDAVLSQQADQEFMSNRTNILLLGIDESEEREEWGSFRTDTIMLVTIDFSTNDVALISIPRDSYVKIYNSNGELYDELAPMDKINSAFSSGGGAEKKGFEYTMNTIEKLLGIPVDQYCAFNMNVVKDVVDAMGGVDYYVDVEVNMNGRHLDIGQQHLDGQAVLDYCRQRKGSSDIARIDRQQRMLEAILNQLKSTNQIVKIPSIYSAVESNLMTNLSFRQISSLALVALRMDMAQLSRYTLDGHANDIYGRSCWCLDVAKLEKLVKTVWGKNVTLDPEIDEEYILTQIETNRQLIINEYNAGVRAYNKAYTLLNDYKSMLDKESYDTLKQYSKALEKAIEQENKDLLLAYTSPVEQLCRSICNQYGISLY